MGSRGYLLSQCHDEGRSRVDELFDQADYGYISANEFLLQVAEVMGLSPDELQGMLNRRYTRDENMLDLVRTVKKRHKTALLSNANNSIIRKLFSQEELDELFDGVIISSEVGMVKPSIELFKFTATRIGCLPEECIMVDDLDINVRAAEDAGMSGVVFRDRKQCEQELLGYGVNA